MKKTSYRAPRITGAWRKNIEDYFDHSTYKSTRKLRKIAKDGMTLPAGIKNVYGTAHSVMSARGFGFR